jgi:hypothetical protein
LVLRPGRIHSRNSTAALIRENRDLREASAQAFIAATERMIVLFGTAVTKFEADAREGKPMFT